MPLWLQSIANHWAIVVLDEKQLALNFLPNEELVNATLLTK